MLKFKTSCSVLAYLSSNLLNEVGLSLFRYFEVGLRVCDIVVKNSRSLSYLLMSSCCCLLFSGFFACKTMDLSSSVLCFYIIHLFVIVF